MLFCIVLQLIAVFSRCAVGEGFFTCCTADRAALVVDSRRSTGRGRFQILSIHSFLIVMRRQFTIRCAAGGANSLCSAGCLAAAMSCFVGLRMADAAFFPMLFCIVLLYIVVRSLFTILKRLGTRCAADGAALVVDGRRSAGRSGFQILLIHSFLILMTGSFSDNRIFIRDLVRAIGIREPLFAGRAFPIRRVAIFRAGCVLCRNSGQRVADCDLRRSNDGSNIFKIREGCTLLEKFTENRNVLLLCVTFQNFKRQCKQYAFARRYIRLFFCTSRSRSYRTTICFAVVFNRIGFNNHKHVFNIRNFIFFIANGDFIFRIDGY